MKRHGTAEMFLRTAVPPFAPLLSASPTAEIPARFANFLPVRLVWSAVLAYYTAPTTAGTVPIWRLERWQSG